MTVWHSSDLGWKPGQDVSDEFIALLSRSFRAGDTLVLEDTFQISGTNIRLPQNFRLTAENGDGFNVRTSATDGSALFVLSNGVTVDNVTFTAVNAPKTGTSAINTIAGTDYHRKRLLVVEGDGVTIEDSAFIGNVNMHIDVQEQDDLVIDSSYFQGGHYQVRLVGRTDDATISGSHFKKSLGDGIKTESVGAYGPQRTLVVDSFFEDNNRDGIDTAGGFKDGTIRDSLFYSNFHEIDIKSGYNNADDLSPYKSNTGITIDGSHFIHNSGWAIAVSVINRNGVLRSSNDEVMPHDIRIANSTFENRSSSTDAGAFLIKDGYDITWDNISLLGRTQEMRFLGAEADFGLSGTRLGGDATNGQPRNVPLSDLWPNDPGPVQNGEANSTPGTGAPAPEPAPTPAPTPSGDTDVSINAGGSGHGEFVSDAHFSGGSIYRTSAAINNTALDSIYQNVRFGDFGYSVPVENGSYKVTLKFAEIFFDAPGKRVFDVYAEDDLVIDNLDIYAKAGKDAAYDRTVLVEVADGSLDLDFESVVNNAALGGFEIDPV